jgi:CBS domain-containing protein/uncharacterized protein (DUF2267 family)
MSLRWYVRPRVVALNSSTSVLDAARAIERNNIGAVVVQDQGRVVGIVTDRDIAVRVLGRGLDARTTTLGQVMSTDVVTLEAKDSQASAIRLMQTRNIRRIPLVEGQRFVGIVTLDDLLLDEAAPIDRLASIIEAQIGEGGPATTSWSPARRRSAARAAATYQRVMNQVRADTGLDDEVQAESALEIVLEALVRRLDPGEAEDLIAQLPSLLQPWLYTLAPGPDKRVTRQSIEQQLMQRLGVETLRAAELLPAIGALIARIVSAGQMDDVRGQLPKDLRKVFSDAPAPTAA